MNFVRGGGSATARVGVTETSKYVRDPDGYEFNEGQAVTQVLVSASLDALIGVFSKPHTELATTSQAVNVPTDEEALLREVFDENYRQMSAEEIKQAYRSLASTNHPDVVGHVGEETMKRINAAYDIYGQRILGKAQSSWQIATAAQVNGDAAGYQQAASDFASSVKDLQTIVSAGMGGGKAAVDYASQSLSNAGKALIETIQGLGADTQKTASTGEAGSTYIDTDPTTHTPEQQAVINEYQAATDKGILAFVERWRGLKDPNYRKKVRMDIASVNQRTARDVKAAVGVDVSDFTSHSLSGNALEHIEIRHGESGKADHSMADPNDIARMGYVLEHYDSVEALVDKNGNQVLSREYYNTDGSHAAVVRFSKRVDGTYYVVEAVPDSATKEFRVISAYMEKGSDGTSRELGVPQSDPQPTSKTGLNARAITSDSSITEASTAVKPEGESAAGTGTASASPEAGLDKTQRRVETAPTLQDQMLQILLQVNTEAWRKKPSTDSTPQSVLRQFKPLLEKTLTGSSARLWPSFWAVPTPLRTRTWHSLCPASWPTPRSMPVYRPWTCRLNNESFSAQNWKQAKLPPGGS